MRVLSFILCGLMVASISFAQEELTIYQVRHGDLVGQRDDPPVVPRPRYVIEPTGGFDKVEYRNVVGDQTEDRGRVWSDPRQPTRGPAVGLGLVEDLSFESLDLAASSNISGFLFTPPDTMGAIGPTEYFTTQNGAYRVHDKATGAVIAALDIADNDFWVPAVDPNNNGGGDPRIRFDRINDRWVIIAFELGASGTGDANNRLMIATSDGPTLDMNTVWTQYYIVPKDAANGSDLNGCFADYPMLAVDANAILIGANYFARNGNCEQSGFGGVNTAVLLIPLATLPGGGGSVAAISTAFTDLLDTPSIWTPMPADNPDPNADTSYVIGHNGSSDTILELGKITNVNGAPGTPSIAWSDVAVSDKNDGYGNGVPYPGVPSPTAANFGLDPLGFRPLGGAMVRDGSLWTAMTSSVDGPTGTLQLFPATGDRHSVVFFEVDVSTDTLEQDGNVFDQSTARGADPFHTWMGAVAVNGQGHAVVGATVANTTTIAPSAAWAGRLADDPLGEFSEPAIYLPGIDTGDMRQSFETSSRPTRWGDYAQVTVDPCDDMTFWTIAEYQDSPAVATGGNWASGVAKILAPAPTFDSVVPSLLFESSVTVMVNGTGFYDPPTDGMPSCRSGLEILTDPVDLVVTDVTYISPIAVQVTFDTTGASRGPVDVTLVNPDGQEFTFQVVVDDPPLFADGFESGDTTAWTNTLP